MIYFILILCEYLLYIGCIIIDVQFAIIEHSNYMVVTNILQLFLNLDINKHQSTNQAEERLKLKLDVINKIINKIETETTMCLSSSHTTLGTTTS